MTSAGAIVVGGYANGVSAVRALASAGLEVEVVTTMPADIAQYSRYVRRSHCLLELESEPDSLIALLERNARRLKNWVIIPTNDRALSVLAKHHERLQSTFTLTMPPWEITRRVINKRLTAEYASDVGIEVPQNYGTATPAVLEAARLDFPVVVKPHKSHEFVHRFGQKLFLVNSREELTCALHDLAGTNIECDVIDLIPGPEGSTYHYQTYIDRHGDPIAEFTLRKLRQSPPHFGVARAAEPARVPQLREPTIELLRRIEWRGMASVAYKRDERNGRFYLMEVNGRCFLTHGLARRAGINFPLLAFSEMMSGRCEGAAENGWTGVWLHLHTDFLYTILGLRRELPDRDFWRSYARSKTYAVWSYRDPRPFLAQWAFTLRQLGRTLVDPAARKQMMGRVQWPGWGQV